MKCCLNIWKAIPLAFNDSLSYLEMLCSLLDDLNNTKLEVEKQNNALIELTKEVNEIKQKLEEILNDIDKKLNDFYIKINNETDKKIKNLTSLFNEFAINLNTLVELKYAELDEKIKKLEIGKIYVYDPTTGELTYIDVVLNNIYDMLRFNAITAGEFDALNLTALSFDNKELTAYNFDINGKVELTRG